MNQIPWRDNGLLISALGVVLLIALVLTEMVFQQIKYQQPVIHFDLQVDYEVDTEEDSDTSVSLSSDELAIVRSIISKIVGQEDKDISWEWLRQQYPEATNQIWLDVAKSASKRRYRKTANAIVERILQQEPESLDALYQSAKLASDTDNEVEAIEKYQHLLGIYPNHQASLINLGLLLSRQGRYQEAIAVQTNAVEVSSGIRKAKAYSIRASGHIGLENYLAAVSDFQSSIQYRPTHAPTWRKLANTLLLAGGDKLEVLKAFNQSVSMQADYLQALHDRGRFHWLRGEYAFARQDLEKIKAVAPDFESARWTLLHLYIAIDRMRSAHEEVRWLKKQKLSETEDDFLQAIEWWIDEDYTKAQKSFASLSVGRSNRLWAKYYLSLSHLHVKERRSDKSSVEKAKELADKIDLLRPVSADQWLSSLGKIALANTLFELQQNDDAISILQQLAFEYPQSHSYAYLLGKMYLDADLYLEAASALQRAQKLKQDDSQTRLSLAVAYRRAGQNELALKTYEALLTVEPNHRTGRYNYARLLDRIDRDDEAVEQYLLALERDPDNINIMYRLANLYTGQEQYQSAINLIEEALAARPTFHRARELLVEINFRQNNLDAALTEINRLLVLDQSRLSAKLLKSDILRDQQQLQQAADILLEIPAENTSRNLLVKLFNIGKRALDNNQLLLAENCNNEVINRDPTFDKAWVNLSSALNRSEKYEDTVKLLSNQSELLAGNHKLTINLAQAHHLLGNSRVAITLLEPLQRQDLLSDEGELVLAASYQNL